jgi:hypothetical protein
VSGLTAVAGEIDVGAARLHGSLQVLAPGLGLVPRIAEGRTPELRQDPHRTRESGITDGDDELELAPPCLAVGPLLGGQPHRWIQLSERVHDVSIQPGALIDEDRQDGHAILTRGGLIEPDPKVPTEPAFLDVRVLAHPLELGEVVAGRRAWARVPAAACGDHEQDGERATNPHDRQRVSGPPGTATLSRGTGFRPKPDRMPHHELRVVLEWLGLVEPDRSRREPIVLPSWAPWAVPLFLVAVAALGAIAVSALLGL